MINFFKQTTLIINFIICLHKIEIFFKTQTLESLFLPLENNKL